MTTKFSSCYYKYKTMESQIKNSVKEFAKKAMAEVKIDIDIKYCKEKGIKYNNHEIDASRVDLFDTESTKSAFNFITKSR